MTFTSRLRVLFRTKTSRALDRLEDPREALDDSYDQQVAMLQQVRQGLAEVATAKKRIELQGQEMGARHRRLAAQADQALSQGREDLARTALERRALLESQVAAIRDQFTGLQQQQQRLQDNERRLAERVTAFRTEKESIKASYAASVAQVKANEAAAGIGSQATDVGVNLDRAKDKVAQMQARAAATDELLANGALNDLTAPPDADLERQLSNGAIQADVERQLQSMKSARAAHAPRRAGDENPDAWLRIGQGQG
ncbi:PspA/IM30 family protein [Cryobacterium sp.]|jgi:phage shock protein A|uniref:PspA/IM30 family protein n=1 Tax=Cryobacterium sp. TaxID=1926290 RepID=UPI0026259493|nr:PspA/IM30 family protein [Cryobacterium sp.]MCU1444854.1 phage shock protein [Cryobacterium sp.]